jgi:PHD/YefM family antitoxin component YafN of YafNO toxin-antitoxin module
MLGDSRVRQLAMLLRPQGPAAGGNREQNRPPSGWHPPKLNLPWPRGSGQFFGLSRGDPAHCCIFGHIRHNWPGATQSRMKILTANDAKYGVGQLIDLARKPATMAKHGHPVVVVIAVEEYERMKVLDAPAAVRAPRRKAKQ